MSKNVLVCIEQREGRILPASFQLLALASELAKATGGQVEACLVGENVGGLVDAVAAHGAKKVYTVDDPALALYRAMPYTTAVSGVLNAAQPKIVLFTPSMVRKLFIDDSYLLKLERND